MGFLWHVKGILGSTFSSLPSQFPPTQAWIFKYCECACYKELFKNAYKSSSGLELFDASYFTWEIKALGWMCPIKNQ